MTPIFVSRNVRSGRLQTLAVGESFFTTSQKPAGA